MKVLCAAALFALLVIPVHATGTSKACEPVTIDFSSLPDSTPLAGGTYLHDEWLQTYGLTLSTQGGLGNKPRLFNTSDVGTSGDPDLGSPNHRCPTPGPGKGEGGEPDEIGANCKPLGNVLIIQEDNDKPEIPDDNWRGGIISFKFDKPQRVKEIGLLDIDYKSFITVMTETGSHDILVPLLGDNSFQVVKINQGNVVELKLNLLRSGAVSFLSFCYAPGSRLDIGEPCQDKAECKSDYCFVDAGVCTCNPSTNSGCSNNKVCALQQGATNSIPNCYLPMGAACSTDSECASGKCIPNSAGSTVCTTDLADLDEPCYEDSDCVTNACYFHFSVPPGEPGFCNCNLETEAGCSDGFVCEDPNNIRGWFDVPWGCYLPFGADCSEHKTCLTGNCDPITTTCACVEYTHYPCEVDDGEYCYTDKDSGIWSCLTESILYEMDPRLNEISKEDAAEIHEHCFFNRPASLARIWPGHEDVPDHIALCPGQSATVDPDGTQYHFVLANGKSIFITCPDGASPNEMCAVTGDGLISELFGPCFENEDCITDSCYYHFTVPGDETGFCNCNLQTNAGCEAGFVCEDPNEPQGSYDVPWGCYLPFGADCSEATGRCLTGNCDPITSKCECSVYSHYPCDDGEYCYTNDSGVWSCLSEPILYEMDPRVNQISVQDAAEILDHCFYERPASLARIWPGNEDVPNHIVLCPSNDARFDQDANQYQYTLLNNKSIFITCPDGASPNEMCAVTGDGLISELFGPCFENEDCDTEACYYHFTVPEDETGFCNCNLQTNAGCEAGFVCEDPNEPQGSYDVPRGCYLPFGAACSPETGRCLTGNCDPTTYRCACNEYTDYPCDVDNGERCLEVDGTWRCRQ